MPVLFVHFNGHDVAHPTGLKQTPDQTDETAIPNFVAMVSMYAAVITYATQTRQFLGQVTELCPLTCPIAKCPVLSE